MEAQDNPFTSILMVGAADPEALSLDADPSAGSYRLVMGTDDKLYILDETGNAVEVGAAAGAVATDAIWDAAGDLAVGSGANTAAKLTKGSDGTILTMTAGAVGWAAPAAGLPAAHGVRAYRSATDVAVGNNTYTAITFNAETYDTDTMHDTSSNTTRFVVPSISGVTTGLWAITARGYSNATTGRSDMMFRANANAVNSGGTLIGTVIGPNISSSGVSTWQGDERAVLTAGDYVELFVRTTGGSFSVVFEAGDSPIFAMEFIGKVT